MVYKTFNRKKKLLHTIFVDKDMLNIIRRGKKRLCPTMKQPIKRGIYTFTRQ